MNQALANWLSSNWMLALSALIGAVLTRWIGRLLHELGSIASSRIIDLLAAVIRRRLRLPESPEGSKQTGVKAGRPRRLGVKAGKVLAFITLPVMLLRCLARSRKLSRWLLEQAVRFIPAEQRDRYYWEWLANLQQLEREGKPTLSEGITLLRAGAQIGGRHRAELAGVQAKRRARRLGPAWVGLLTCLGSFLIALSSLLVATSSPTKPQLGTAVVGSILLGVVAGDQARKAKSEDHQA
jgi:hypothetical protein